MKSQSIPLAEVVQAEPLVNTVFVSVLTNTKPDLWLVDVLPLSVYYHCRCKTRE